MAEKHWLFRDLTEYAEEKTPFQDWFKARNWSVLAVGANWKPPKFVVVERPPSTDPASLGRYMKAIREGVETRFQDFSRKALVYSETEYMYYFVEGEKSSHSSTLFTKEEEKILKRHNVVPSREIYHLTDNPDSILKHNRLFTGAGRMLSLTANPRLRYVIPERTPRRFRLVLDFAKLKEEYGRWLFPVYYYTEQEWYETEPPEWLVNYYKGKDVTLYHDVERWNTAPAIYLGEDLFAEESEWKCMRNIYPVSKFLIEVRKVRW